MLDITLTLINWQYEIPLDIRFRVDLTHTQKEKENGAMIFRHMYRLRLFGRANPLTTIIFFSSSELNQDRI